MKEQMLISIRCNIKKRKKRMTRDASLSIEKDICLTERQRMRKFEYQITLFC